MYAVIELQWHQYIVQEGDQIIVDKIDMEDGKTFDVEDVLAVFDEKAENVKVGTPNLKGNVTCEVVKFQKGDKIKVIRFKRKNRYTRTVGFRPYQTVLNIKKVTVNG